MIRIVWQKGKLLNLHLKNHGFLLWCKKILSKGIFKNKSVNSENDLSGSTI